MYFLYGANRGLVNSSRVRRYLSTVRLIIFAYSQMVYHRAVTDQSRARRRILILTWRHNIELCKRDYIYDFYISYSCVRKYN